MSGAEASMSGNPWFDYARDAAERSVLFLDVLRQRGNNYHERIERIAPHVLTFAVELVCDGRQLERPVNYLLVEIRPPEGVSVDLRKRPFIVIDPLDALVIIVATLTQHVEKKHGPLRRVARVVEPGIAAHGCFGAGHEPPPSTVEGEANTSTLDAH